MDINSISTKVTDGGRIVIPAEYRRALSLNVGDDVVLSLEAGEIRHKGLSLGDRACLSLAIEHHLPVMTTDRVWGSLDVGIAVNVVR